MSDENPSVPVGFCQCGCGGKTRVPTKTDRNRDDFKGEPKRFIRGHNSWKHRAPAEVREREFCECGCGERTPVATYTRAHDGIYKGFPVRFLNGHSTRLNQPKLIWAEEDRGYETPCWIWQRCVASDGYGRVTFGGKARRAHVAVYEQERGHVPDGLQLDHLCRVRSCVNPDHLEPVTNAENCRRGAKATLTKAAVRTIRRDLENGRSQYAIARDHGVTQSTISLIARGKLWQGV